MILDKTGTFKISHKWECVKSLDELIDDSKFIFSSNSYKGKRPKIVLNNSINGIDCIEIDYEKDGLITNAECVFSETWGNGIIDSSKDCVSFIRDFLIKDEAADLLVNYEERNCAFQFWKSFWRDSNASSGEIICDKSSLTKTEAQKLWNQYYPECAKHIHDGGTCEMALWVDMIDSSSYNKTDQYISTDAESDGVRIWVIEKRHFKPYDNK